MGNYLDMNFIWIAVFGIAIILGALLGMTYILYRQMVRYLNSYCYALYYQLKILFSLEIDVSHHAEQAYVDLLISDLRKPLFSIYTKPRQKITLDLCKCSFSVLQQYRNSSSNDTMIHTPREWFNEQEYDLIWLLVRLNRRTAYLGRTMAKFKNFWSVYKATQSIRGFVASRLEEKRNTEFA